MQPQLWGEENRHPRSEGPREAAGRLFRLSQEVRQREQSKDDGPGPQVTGQKPREPSKGPNWESKAWPSGSLCSLPFPPRPSLPDLPSPTFSLTFPMAGRSAQTRP